MKTTDAMELMTLRIGAFSAVAGAIATPGGEPRRSGRTTLLALELTEIMDLDRRISTLEKLRADTDARSVAEHGTVNLEHGDTREIEAEKSELDPGTAGARATK